ncbi:hypothetical protein Poly41_22420 [Novipirellula artificiosorum]|uniref:Uncharacterized protein n=1 Tax=Novipirellula artificiosorum TaxID=2528016 RepID=A0A5C6DRM6_9BACT|nr:hypothetical protein Poly41_22420 [Novipirellula artificiosorum]
MEFKHIILGFVVPLGETHTTMARILKDLAVSPHLCPILRHSLAGKPQLRILID